MHYRRGSSFFGRTSRARVDDVGVTAPANLAVARVVARRRHGLAVLELDEA